VHEACCIGKNDEGDTFQARLAVGNYLHGATRSFNHTPLTTKDKIEQLLFQGVSIQSRHD